ncbi:MAG: hypothetical protein QM758_10915 [Armatimonas sp.]
MKHTNAIFLIPLSALGLMALTTAAHSDPEGTTNSYDNAYDSSYANSYDNSYAGDTDSSDAGKSASGGGSFSGQSLVAVGVGALLLSQVAKKGKSSSGATSPTSKDVGAVNSGSLTPSPSPKPSSSPKPSPSPSPNPLSLAPPDLTPELPAGVQAIPVLLAVGGMALYQRKKKSA